MDAKLYIANQEQMLNELKTKLVRQKTEDILAEMDQEKAGLGLPAEPGPETTPPAEPGPSQPAESAAPSAPASSAVDNAFQELERATGQD